MSARTLRTHLLFAAVVAGFVALALLLAPGTAAAVTTATDAPTTTQHTTPGTLPGGAGQYVDPLVALVAGPDTDVTPAESSVILEAASVARDGFAHHVSSARITLTLQEAYGFTVEEAHRVMGAVIARG